MVMKIIKTANYAKLSLSKAEWLTLGYNAGWLKKAQQTPLDGNPMTPNPAPSVPPVAAKPKRIADEIIDYPQGEDISDVLLSEIPELAAGRVTQENDGIGPYEFWGQKSFDKGRDYEVLETFTVAMDVTGSQYDDVRNPETSAELPLVSGPVGDGDMQWVASGNPKQVGDRVFAVYTVSEQQ